jgi:hypothetical protein
MSRRPGWPDQDMRDRGNVRGNRDSHSRRSTVSRSDRWAISPSSASPRQLRPPTAVPRCAGRRCRRWGAHGGPASGGSAIFTPPGWDSDSAGSRASGACARPRYSMPAHTTISLTPMLRSQPQRPTCCLGSPGTGWRGDRAATGGGCFGISAAMCRARSTSCPTVPARGSSRSRRTTRRGCFAIWRLVAYRFLVRPPSVAADRALP